MHLGDVLIELMRKYEFLSNKPEEAAARDVLRSASVLEFLTLYFCNFAALAQSSGTWLSTHNCAGILLEYVYFEL